MEKIELKDKSQMNKYDNHIEHSKLNEISLNTRALHNKISLEEMVHKNTLGICKTIRNNFNKIFDIKKQNKHCFNK